MYKPVKYLFGSAGPSGFGSKSTAEEVTATCSDLSSITAIITGATSGIGAEVARVLAKRGVQLVLPVRHMKKAEEKKARIVSECPGSEIILLPLDLSSLSSVHSFVSRFLVLGLPLNLLINNAGKFGTRHELSEDGVEMNFATNYLGHFLLTKLLLAKMSETAKETGIEGRIVNVTASFHSWFTGDTIQYLEQITSKKTYVVLSGIKVTENNTTSCSYHMLCGSAPVGSWRVWKIFLKLPVYNSIEAGIKQPGGIKIMGNF